MKTGVATVCIGMCSLAGAGDDVARFHDGFGDTAIHRTDTGCAGQLHQDTNLPDLLRTTLSAWQPNDALVDPYTGVVVDKNDADIFRLDVSFAGLVNPSGTIGLGGKPFEPFRFGTSPVLGFLEMDLDDDKDTGGELGGEAELRFLANVGRFAGMPDSRLAERVATSGAGPGGCGDLDLDFWTGPFYERSGEDFALVMCGCHEVTVISQSGGDNDEIFEAGETWVVRSRYFKRAAGYKDASSVFGGTNFGLYDPWVNIRFQHDLATDITTITLVEALTMAGAAQLTGEPEQAIDSEIGPFSHHSVIEAIQDLIDNARGQSGEVQVLIEGWDGERADDVLDPTDWSINALFGTSYATVQDGLYVWTDVGYDVRVCDLNADETVDDLDVSAFDQALATLDGGSCDADGQVNGRVVIPGCGPNFSIFDLDGNGVIELEDRALFCRGDLTGSSNPNNPDYGIPNGVVDADDFFYYLDHFASRDLAEADLTGSSNPDDSEYGMPNLVIDSSDFFFYLDLFVAGCP